MEVAVSSPRLLAGTLAFQRSTKSPPFSLSLRTSQRCSLTNGRNVSSPSLRTAAMSSRQGYLSVEIGDTRRSPSRPQPPDLASYLYSNRVVYLATPIVPLVMELIVAQLLYLQAEDNEKPISFYINSTGTLKDGEKLGNELEALGIYDVMRYIEAPICTLCIGKAWGEAALLLAAGDRGCRAALPSSSIMIREPVAKFDGQVSDVVLAREEFSSIKGQMVNILSEHTGKPPEQIEQDIRWPKYFSPSAAVEYGIIDRVVSNDLVQENQALMLDLKSAELSQGSGIST
ncbi:Endopeptidase Clp protein [Dioscorea alata]|uniref:Endopeptidase Clp protein n=1 Tax=Dioscorea alata TaxID=55571 RepID=A0ACB7WHX3_DIOAL|nr:Endopeptidase Clp protein [Dioscorea alata]